VGKWAEYSIRAPPRVHGAHACVHTHTRYITPMYSAHQEKKDRCPTVHLAMI